MSMSVQSLQSYNFTRLKDANAEALQGKVMARAYVSEDAMRAAAASQSNFASMVSGGVAESADRVSLSAEAQKSLESQSKTNSEYASGAAWKAAREKEGVFEKYQEAGDKVVLPTLIRMVMPGRGSSEKSGYVDPAEVKASFGNYFVSKMEQGIDTIMSNLQGWQHNTLRVEELSQDAENGGVAQSLLQDSEAMASEQFGRVVEEFDKLTEWASKNGVEEDAQQFFSEYTEKYYGQKLDFNALSSMVASST